MQVNSTLLSGIDIFVIDPIYQPFGEPIPEPVVDLIHVPASGPLPEPVIDPIYAPLIPMISIQTSLEQKDIPLPGFSSAFPNYFNANITPDSNSGTHLDVNVNNILDEGIQTDCDNKSELRKVQQQVIEPDGKTLKKCFKCEECPKEYRRKKDLANHEMMHRGERPYQCDICNKTFRMMPILKQHLYIHSNEKRYQCSECGKCFSQRNTLQIHQRLHNVNFFYKCPVCGRKVKQKSNLAAHMLIHSDYNPHHCSCGKSFKRKWNFQMHLKNNESCGHVPKL